MCVSLNSPKLYCYAPLQRVEPREREVTYLLGSQQTVRGGVGTELRYFGSRITVNTVLFLKVERKCSKPCSLRVG